MSCLFCQIAARHVDAVVIYEDDDIVAFLDVAPIREGHTQIIPRKHHDTFDQMPAELMGRITLLGQQLARKMKAVFRVERVGLVFTGGDIAHVHAHVVPIHEKTDITSARYFARNREPLEFGDAHLKVSRAALIRTQQALDFVPE